MTKLNKLRTQLIALETQQKIARETLLILENEIKVVDLKIDNLEFDRTIDLQNRQRNNR